MVVILKKITEFEKKFPQRGNSSKKYKREFWSESRAKTATEISELDIEFDVKTNMKFEGERTVG